MEYLKRRWQQLHQDNAAEVFADLDATFQYIETPEGVRAAELIPRNPVGYPFVIRKGFGEFAPTYYEFMAACSEANIATVCMEDERVNTNGKREEELSRQEIIDESDRMGNDLVSLIQYTRQRYDVPQVDAMGTSLGSIALGKAKLILDANLNTGERFDEPQIGTIILNSPACLTDDRMIKLGIGFLQMVIDEKGHDLLEGRFSNFGRDTIDFFRYMRNLQKSLGEWRTAARTNLANALTPFASSIWIVHTEGDHLFKMPAVKNAARWMGIPPERQYYLKGSHGAKMDETFVDIIQSILAEGRLARQAPLPTDSTSARILPPDEELFASP